MPLIVDHEQRRIEVADIAIRLIVENGVEKASVRSIAQAAGYSTAIVSHYFHNKSELLLMCYQQTLARTNARMIAAMDSGADTQTVLEHLLPLDDVSRDSWKIWFAFWGMGLADAAIQKEQIMRGREAQALIGQVLDRDAAIVPDRTPGREMQTGRLLAILVGLATQATYDPDGWPVDRQRAMLAQELATMRG